MKRSVCFSIDVDSVKTHLRGYGIEDGIDRGEEFQLAIPRALSLFKSALFKSKNIKATFFLIAENAAKYPDIVAQIIRDGHEVASHSLTHTIPFNISDREVYKKELVQSKEVLEKLTGSAVVGFRAPSWDMDRKLYDLLREANYQYDASIYPSPLLYLLRYRLSKGPQFAPISFWKLLTQNPNPHQIDTKAGKLVEIPLATSAIFRIPYYHTFSYLLPPTLFHLLGELTSLSRSVISYAFHAVDFLDLVGDKLDPRLAQHPGMKLDLQQKILGIERILSKLTTKRSPHTLKEVAQWASFS